MDIQLLTDYEKTQVDDRQPLPADYLRLPDDGVGRFASPRPRRRSATASSSSAITTSATKSSSSPTASATPSSWRSSRPATTGRERRVLRRALHGRERRRAERAAPARDPAGPGRGLLDGRHGRHRSARGLLGRTADARRVGRDSGHLHQLDGRHQSLLRRTRRHRLHVEQRRRASWRGRGSGARSS